MLNDEDDHRYPYYHRRNCCHSVGCHSWALHLLCTMANILIDVAQHWHYCSRYSEGTNKKCFNIFVFPPSYHIWYTFHNSVMSCKLVLASELNSMHMTRNLSLFNVANSWPCCRTTLILVVAPGASTPVLGRTRNFSGEVVFICS